MKSLSSNNDRRLMIVLDVIGLVVCLTTLILFPELEGEVRGIIASIAAYFGLGLRDAHQFEFGSSRGSVEKNKWREKDAGETPLE